jgi:hypothetical protein
VIGLEPRRIVRTEEAAGNPEEAREPRNQDREASPARNMSDQTAPSSTAPNQNACQNPYSTNTFPSIVPASTRGMVVSGRQVTTRPSTKIGRSAAK